MLAPGLGEHAFWLAGYDEAIHSKVLTSENQGDSTKTQDIYTINGMHVPEEVFKQRVGSTPPLKPLQGDKVKHQINPGTNAAAIAETVNAVYHIPRQSTFCQIL